jgi:hypothetical protein
LIGQQPHRQQVSAEHIAHRQWVHSLAIGSAKPAFEIYRPDMIAPSGDRQYFPLHQRSFARSTATNSAQLESAQAVGDGPHTRDFSWPILPAQGRSDFFSSPLVVVSSQVANSFHPHPPDLGRRVPWPTRLVPQTPPPILPKTRYPFVACFAADLEELTQFDDRFAGLQGRFHKPPTLSQNRY